MAYQMPWANKRTQQEAAIQEGWKSGLEEVVAKQLREAGVKVEYETFQIEYVKPQRTSKYKPDFVLPNGIIVETKGRFITPDRQKHILVKKQHPALDIRFVFSSSKNRISKTSSTTYAMWCQKHGFQFADDLIPAAWLKEKPKHA